MVLQLDLGFLFSDPLVTKRGNGSSDPLPRLDFRRENRLIMDSLHGTGTLRHTHTHNDATHTTPQHTHTHTHTYTSHPLNPHAVLMRHVTATCVGVFLRVRQDNATIGKFSEMINSGCRVRAW